MKILAFSDLHRDRAAADAIVAAAIGADLVIGAGDFASAHQGLDEVMDWLAPIAAKAVYVPGNNETADALRTATTAQVLHGEVTRRDGLAIVGLGAAVPPITPPGWTSFNMTEDQAATMLGRFDAADILISHSPPKGFADILAVRGSIGSTAILAAARRLFPAYLFCGHVHDCWGQRGWIGGTEVVNLGPTLNWIELPQ
jgi:Icc-related predicted phosphoesterase